MSRGLRVWGAVALLASTLSCGARSGVLLSDDDPTAAAGVSSTVASACNSGPTKCVARGDDPCGATHMVSPTCDAASLVRSCPASSWPYRRAADTGAACLPTFGAQSPIVAMGGALAQVPTDDGRCLWIAESVQLSSGAVLRNVAFEPDPRAPFGTCPEAPAFIGGAPTASVRFADDSDDTRLQVQISSAYRMHGVTRVAYRLFRIDPAATFGVTELGTSLGSWDAQTQRVVVSGPDQLEFPPNLDFGHATLADDTYVYSWGCNAPGHFLTEGCLLSRTDDANQVQILLDGDVWVADTRAGDPEVVFDDGPWISSVTQDRAHSADLLHVFAVDFGSNLQLQRAPKPEGPWADATPIADCALPKKDGMAYCAGVIVHDELADPTRPSEIVVSYGIGTTAAKGTGNAADYWSQLVWLSPQ